MISEVMSIIAFSRDFDGMMIKVEKLISENIEVWLIYPDHKLFPADHHMIDHAGIDIFSV